MTRSPGLRSLTRNSLSAAVASASPRGRRRPRSTRAPSRRRGGRWTPGAGPRRGCGSGSVVVMCTCTIGRSISGQAARATSATVPSSWGTGPGRPEAQPVDRVLAQRARRVNRRVLRDERLVARDLRHLGSSCLAHQRVYRQPRLCVSRVPRSVIASSRHRRAAPFSRSCPLSDRRRRARRRASAPDRPPTRRSHPARGRRAGRAGGSARASAGSHQFASPSSSIVAGTSTTRTIVASIATATARPRPISLSARRSRDHEAAEHEHHDQRGGGDDPRGAREAVGDGRRRCRAVRS